MLTAFRSHSGKRTDVFQVNRPAEEMTHTFKITKKNQSLRRYPQTSPLQDSLSTASTKARPGKREKLLEQPGVQKINTSGNAQEALAAKVERLLKLRAPAPPIVRRRGRVLRPVQQETLEHVKAHQPDINTPCGSQWVTEYTGNFGFPQVVHPPCALKNTAHPLASVFQSTPATLFADKYRRTEYQAVYGPKIRTAHFNVTLYRQIHGTA
ncbi:uncharacterized protein LOC117599196 [Pangasianodon hypophthalmus]|uniref:uncharacterized protein LOC117599196 n=1 Tax=Pangasianodon hypophthalmus TaxID=310915 RepID=UPI001480114C|nr:uncharacterized protein LOC117599196 [Pangasianodon hypophthalmus]